jgi:hypothetical protein
MTSDAVTPRDLFACQNCGQCCKGYGGTYITESEIDHVGRYLGLDRKRFMRCYCQISGGKPLVAQTENGYCIFWDQLCTIHSDNQIRKCVHDVIKIRNECEMETIY